MASETVWQRLLPWCGDAGHRLSVYIAGVVSALMVPVQIILIGVFAQWLTSGGLFTSPVSLGRYLQIPFSEEFLQRTPHRQLAGILVLAMIVATCQAAALWWFYSGVYRLSRRSRYQMRRAGLDQAMQRSVSGGVATHGEYFEQVLGTDIPVVLEGLRARWRAVPRSIVLLVSCFGLALLVDFWLALLAIVSGLLVWQLYQYLTAHETEIQGDEQLPLVQDSLVDLTVSAPLLARVQPRESINRALDEQLRQESRLIESRDRARARVLPMVVLAVAFCCAMMSLGFGVNRLHDRQVLNLPAAIVLGLSMVGSAVAVSRLLKLRLANQRSIDAAGRLATFFTARPDDVPGQRFGLTALRDEIEMHEVSLRDGRGRLLLEKIQVHLGRGEFVCVLGNDGVAVQAFLELLLGFGQPDEGRVLIDGTSLFDIAPEVLARHILWIDETGPIWAGTIEENLLDGLDPGTANDLYDALRRCGVLERLQRFGDGLGTLVSHNDDRLGADLRYGIAVARAILRRPSVIVVREPTGPRGATHDACSQQLRALADQGTLVVVWPQRLNTLRQADRVIVLREGQLQADGSHGELLESSELYRHLNYNLFNPFDAANAAARPRAISNS